MRLESAMNILQKPVLLVAVPLLYFILVIFSKWRFSLSFDILFFLFGGVVSIYAIDVAEMIAKIRPSPFRSIGFVIGLVIVGFYVLTSTVSMIASGLVLGLLLNILLFQISEWKVKKHLDSWYQMVGSSIPPSVQQAGIFLLGIVFLLQTIIFVL